MRQLVPAVTDTRGILRPADAPAHFRLRRRAPAPDLAPWVERLWAVEWDLRGRAPYEQLLNFPSVNLAVQEDVDGVFGIRLQRDGRTLRGTGWAAGVKFRPGAFRAFWPHPAHELTDRALPLAAAFGEAGEALAAGVRAVAPSQRSIVIERFLRPRRPARDPQLDLIAAVIGTMLDAPGLTRVEAVAERHAVSARTLQRVFREYVGVSPKWVLRRYRLQAAAERIADAPHEDWAAVAVELGYFDQSHFIGDFKAVVGATPAEYAADCARTDAQAA